MKILRMFGVFGLALFLLPAGCQKPTTERHSTEQHAVEPSKEETIQATLAKLPAEDRPLAEAQKFCAVAEESRLGSMGVPLKVMVKDQPVFLCCKSCQKKALAEPDKTLATVEKLKASAAKP